MGTVNDSPANFEIASLQRMPCGLQGKLLGIVLIHRPKQQLLATDRDWLHPNLSCTLAVVKVGETNIVR